MADAVADQEQDQKPWDLYAAKKPWELYGQPAPESIDQEDSVLSPPAPPPPPPPPNPLDASQLTAGIRDPRSIGGDISADLQKAQNLLERGGAAVFNEPATFMRDLTGKIPQVTVAGTDAQGRPTLGQADAPLPFQPGQSIYTPKGTIENPTGNDAQKLISGFLTPGNIASFPFAAAKPVQAAFLLQTAPAAVSAAEKLVSPGTQPGDRRAAALDLLVNGVMTHGLAHGLVKGGESNASSISAPAEVPLSDEGNFPLGKGFQTPSGRPINEAMDYSPEDLQKYQDMKAKSVPKTAEEFSSPGFQKNWKDLEQLRNKYNGMPPKQLIESPTTETGVEDTKNEAGVGSAPPQSSEVEPEHGVVKDEATGQYHVVNGKDEILETHDNPHSAQKSANVYNGFKNANLKNTRFESFLDPDDQKIFDSERENIGAPVELTDDAGTKHPFAQNAMAWADRETGRIVVNKDSLKHFVDQLPKKDRGQAIRSVLSEERIHLATDDASAKTYWENLSPWEQAILKRRYTKGVDLQMNDINWGHEALRFRIQQLARMKPTEVALAVGKEKWTLKALSVAEHVIRNARAISSFMKGRESRAILNRIQQNITAARDEIRRSNNPAAFRGRPKVFPTSKEQQDFLLPGMESTRLAGSKIAASNIPGQEGAELPKATPEQIAAGDAVLASKIAQRPSAAQMGVIGADTLKKDVDARLDVAKSGKNIRLPNLKDFTAELKKVWTNLKPGEISDLWSGTVGKFIDNAPGEDLRVLGKAAFGGNLREILSDKAINEKFPGNPKAAVEYARQQERALSREGKKGSSIWNAPVPDKGFDTKAAEQIALNHANDKYPGVGLDPLDIHWADRRAEAEFERRNKLFSEGKIESAPDLEKLKVAALQEVADGKRTASRQYQLERGLAKRQELRSIQSAKRRRAWISSAIFRKMVKPEVSDSEGILNRKSVVPDDVRPSNDGKYSSYQDLKDFPQSKIADALSDKARRSSSDSATVSRRLALLENKRTGEVHLVSAYDHPHGPDLLHDVRVLDPLSPTRTHVPLEDILQRYRALRSVFLDQPVRKFRQDFKDIDDYDDKFGNQVKTDVENAQRYSPESLSTAEFAQEAGGRISEGSGGSFQGPHRDLVSDPARGAAEVAETTPLTDPEFKALSDLMESGGSPRNAADVKRVLQEMVQNKPSAQAISALRKMAAEVSNAHPDWDEDAQLNALAHNIYEKSIQSAKALKKGGVQKAADTGKDVGPAARASNQPAGNKANPAQRGPAGPQVVSPAAFNRRKLEEKRDDTMDKFGVVKQRVSTAFKRKNTADFMAATIDGADTVANNMGQHAEWSVRMESSDGAKNRIGYAKDFRGKKDVLESAPAMLSAGAVKTIHNYDVRALAEKSRLLREDPFFMQWVLNLKSMLGSRSGKDVGYAQKELGAALEKRLIETGFLHHKNAQYVFDNAAKSGLDKFMFQVRQGSEQAKRMSDRGNVWDRYRGRRWLKSNEKIMRSLEYAKAHWDNPEVRATAMRIKRELDRQYDLERDNGGNLLSYDPNYLPGRYDGETWSFDKVLFGGREIMGKEFRRDAVFDNIYHAASVGPYIPASLDGASLVGSRVRQGMHSVTRRMWWNSLKELKDDSGRPVAANGKEEGGRSGPPSPDYREFRLPGDRKTYVLKAYSGLVHQLVDPSQLQHWALTRSILESGQYLKHTVLLGDVFHLGRVAYYGASIMGKNAKFKPGWAATTIREEDLDRAVKSGIIAPQTRDYLKEKVAFRIGPKADMISRSRLSELYERSGLNTGRIQDAIFKDLVRNLPGFSAYNRFLFDRFTTGMMKTAALQEFDRLSKLDPEKDSRQIVQESAKALNDYFGSIGRQGWVKSATFQDIAGTGLLAPQWLEGLIKKEVQPLKLLTSPMNALSGRDTAFRGIARGMVSMLALTQVINLINRGTPTWNNPEDDHKWDAYVGGGVWLSPLAVFNELTSDMLRLSETKGRKWDIAQQIGSNKLGFWGRFATVLASGNSPSGEYQPTTPAVLKTAVQQLVPTPISFGTWAQFLGHMVAPGTVPPVPPGQLLQRAFSTMGVKTHVGLDPVQKVHLAAEVFKSAHGIQEPHIQYTDEPSNSKLRYQVKIGDEAGAARTLSALRKSHPDGAIIDAMTSWARRPFTSADNEQLFVGGMDDEGRKLYQQAIQQRYDEVNKFLDWYNKQPR